MSGLKITIPGSLYRKVVGGTEVADDTDDIQLDELHGIQEPVEIADTPSPLTPSSDDEMISAYNYFNKLAIDNSTLPLQVQVYGFEKQTMALFCQVRRI
jgi:hypothetical protein